MAELIDIDATVKPRLTVDPRWTLGEAVGLVRALQPLIRKFNYHLTLGGGVLNNGYSNKDLDLYFLPMEKGQESSKAGLLAFLAENWGPSSTMATPKKKKRPTMAQADLFARRARVETDDRYRVAYYSPMGVLFGPFPGLEAAFWDWVTRGYHEAYPDMELQGLIAPGQEDPESYPKGKDSVYDERVKFSYQGLRIDVFILGPASQATETEVPGPDLQPGGLPGQLHLPGEVVFQALPDAVPGGEFVAQAQARLGGGNLAEMYLNPPGHYANLNRQG